MPRPKKTVRTIFKNIGVAEDLVARIELEFYSDLQKRVPIGSWQGLIDKLLRRYLLEKDASETGLTGAYNAKA